MEGIFKNVSKVKNTELIVQAMKASTDPWLQAQNYIEDMIKRKQCSKHNGKYALIFAAGWIAEQHNESCRLKQTLEGEVQALKVEMEKLESRLEADSVQRPDQVVALNLQSQDAVCAAENTDNVCVSGSAGQVVSDARPDSGIEIVDGSDSGAGSIAAVAMDGEVEGLTSDKDCMGDSGLVDCVPQTVLPCAQVKLRPNKPNLRCFVCKRLGHIARFCNVSEGSMHRHPQYRRTTPRGFESYSPRWGSLPRHRSWPSSQVRPRAWAPVKHLVAQNALLEQENKQLKDQRDRFWEQLRTSNFVYRRRGNY